MSFNIVVFLLLAFSNGVLADGPPCPGPFNPPNNISTQVVYPVSNNPVTFPTGYNCVYQLLLVHAGLISFAILVIASIARFSHILARTRENDARINFCEKREIRERVYAGKCENVRERENARNARQVRPVSLRDEARNCENRLAGRNSTVYLPKLFNVSASDSQPIIIGGYDLNCCVTAETRASAFTIYFVDEFKRIEDLRSILIFDGPDENSTCLGTAYQLLNSNQQWVSTGKTLSIFQLQPLPYVSGIQLLIQDFEETKEIGEYRGVACVGVCPILMDASKQASAFSTYSYGGSFSDCLFNITGTGTLDVYNGGVTESKSNLIASYSESSNGINLPQAIRGVVRTYVLTGGVATVQVNSLNGCSQLTNNVEGFITSREYKTNLTIPYFNDQQWYLSNVPFNYTLSVQTVDLSQNKSLHLKITNNKTDVLNVVYNSSNPPMLNTVLSGVGNEMDVIYSSPYYGSKKGGFYIDFTATKVKESAVKTYGFIVIFAILWVGFF
ncbi:unnamed protein product [Caenorhabditis nigoni]